MTCEFLRLATAVFAAAVCAFIPGSATCEETPDSGTHGSISGRVVFQGDIPPTRLLVKRGNATVKDSATCAKHDIPDESLIINNRSRGVKHVIVWMIDPPDIPSDQSPANEDEHKFAIEHCRMVPHTLIVRTGRRVRISSPDSVAHNPRALPVINTSPGLITPARGMDQFRSFDRPEPVPIRVKCDIHPWESAWWLVLDHPFADSTNVAGAFAINDVPFGTYTLRVWHERIGYVEKNVKVTVDSAKAKLDPIVITVDDVKN